MKLKKKNNFGKKTDTPTNNGTDDVIEDDRFKIVHYDPRFAKASKKITKLSIDDRFKAMFKDPKFKILTKVDKYGREIEVPEKNKEIEDLYYKDDDENEDEEIEEEIEQEMSEEENKEIKNSSKKDKRQSKVEKKTQLTHFDENGKFKWNEESSSDEEDVPEFTDLAGTEANEWVDEEEENIPRGGDSYRLAMMNYGWENIQSSDIMLTFSSFTGEGYIKKVTVYPSDFGLQRMNEEQKKGPQGIWKKEPVKVSKEENAKFEKKKDIDRPWMVSENTVTDLDTNLLRKYEKNRMKYYYAVIECDSVSTAAKIYEDCNDLEFELTGIKIDLRFIPNDLKFPHEPKEVCTELPAASNVKSFLNRALQHTNIKLTWEEPKANRFQMLHKKMTEKEEEELELSDFIASASESEEDSEDEEETLTKKRDLFFGTNNNEEFQEDDWKADFDKSKRRKKGGDIIIKFNPGFDDLGNKILEKTAEPQKKKKEKVNTKADDDFFVEEEEEPRDEKKYKAELGLLVDGGDSKKSFKIDYSDDRFNSLYKDSRYGIDPTDKNYKADNSKFLHEQLKRRKENKK